ncbi:hypothetical protein GCM10009844_43070 [Nocardioides koreensis]|uniref:DUF305 domain-containing protein n=1 Tax=Nocardioides koreensis TaxID=433651 RepID=A0ABN3A7J7_9ACTN
MHGRHTKVRPHHYAAGVVAVLVALSLALGLAWFNRFRDTGGTAEVSRSASSSTAVDAELATCRAVWRAQSGVLAAAGSSLAQWRVHVDAMNQLVAGEITLAQAQDFWNRTRKGAAERVARFEKADGTYADAAPGCPGGSTGSRADGGSRDLSSCVAGVRARDRAIGAGTVALDTWKHHIMAMEMLRSGQITPEQATRMWLRSWRRGVRQLDTFTEVRRRAAVAGSC